VPRMRTTHVWIEWLSSLCSSNFKCSRL
jgi:hypothetical protein